MEDAAKDSNLGRWCHYCGNSSHHDSECWSTRPAGWIPPGQRTHFAPGFMLPGWSMPKPVSLEDLLIRFGGK